MNDPHRKRLAFLLAHARGMLGAIGENLDDLEAAFRDEDSEQDVKDALEQLALTVFELGHSAHGLTVTAQRWNDLAENGGDPDEPYGIDIDAALG